MRCLANIIPFDKQIEISKEGTARILDILAKHNVKATFYTTANFARHADDIVKRIVSEGPELASHGYVHDHFEPQHLKMSKDILEQIGHVVVNGYRMARMMPVPETEVYKAGYIYNSSINPTYLPGRYNKLHESRTYFRTRRCMAVAGIGYTIIEVPSFWDFISQFASSALLLSRK